MHSVVKMWLGTGFEPPRKFLVDNGGGFANKVYLNLAENFNLEVVHTAAENPWQNGICERNHATVDACVSKLFEDDPSLPLDVVFAWAVNARNAMQDYLGYTPYQLFFGRLPILPAMLNQKLPANERVCMNETVSRNLSALFNARKAFTESEAREKVKRALRNPVRDPNEVIYQPGDKVCFKRSDKIKWRRPG